MEEWVSVLRAADAAARWHVHQRRKGPAQEPYMNHLLEVASLVTEATGGTEPSIVIAALLHDAIEDQEVPAALIAREFWSLWTMPALGQNRKTSEHKISALPPKADIAPYSRQVRFVPISDIARRPRGGLPLSFAESSLPVKILTKCI